jgi:hypothetical protein
MMPSRILPGRSFWNGVIVAGLVVAAGGIGFWMGRSPESNLDRDLAASQIAPFLNASASQGGDDLAVATGPVDEDTEGVFFLDYKTGNLQCWIYYPRSGKFGGKIAGNVAANLSGGKNAKYLMVTGTSNVRGGTNNARPAASIVYVVNTNSGEFAAYSFPWNESAQNSGQVQAGSFVYVGGGKIRQ